MIVFPSVILAMPEGSDRDFMEQLYRNHYKLMFATAWKYLDDKATVEDVVSDACLSLMKKISTLRSLDVHKLRAYIVITIRNAVFDYFDKQKIRNNRFVPLGDDRLGNFASELDLEKKIVLEDELERVCSAINQLSAKEQQIMKMKFFLNLKDDEIARRVGLSVSSIRKYISRARKQIRDIVYAE